MSTQTPIQDCGGSIKSSRRFRLDLTFFVCAIQLLLCLSQASLTLGQTTIANGGVHLRGGSGGDSNSYANSFSTSETSTSLPFLARNYQSPTQQNFPAAAATVTNSAVNQLITSTSSPGGLAQQTSLAPNHLQQLLKRQQLQQQQQQQQQSPQAKTLKFTLAAGKYWKFNIKTNSLQTSHRERELRLHGNDSARNFLINDDGWFQYNHQQQQLFAWPSLSVKPSTYYFVLLPSGLDYEADGENVINPSDVVANIVVELIRPYTGSNTASFKFDIDQLIDYKFSLDYLHRHSAYPLLLSQIVSVFDIFSRSGRIDGGTPSTTTAATALSTTTAYPHQQAASTTQSVLAALQQSKQTRSLSNKFVEFLLIDSSATADGEYFSVTWTTHPSLVNNTVDPIHECRFPAINETVSRLSSSRSILYPSLDDKFVISYSLEGPLVGTQSIIPTERGNFALKLSLLNSCRRKRVIEELGVTSAPGFPTDLIDDRDNSIPDHSTVPTSPISVATTESSPVERQASQPTGGSIGTSNLGGPVVMSASDSLDIPSIKTQTERPVNNVDDVLQTQPTPESRRPVTSQVSQVITEAIPATTTRKSITGYPNLGTYSTEVTPFLRQSGTTDSSSTKPLVRVIEATTPTQVSPIERLVVTQSSQTAGQPYSSPAYERSQDALTQTQTNTRRALESTVAPSPTPVPQPPSPSSTYMQYNQQQTNTQPQAKSFANFLDLQPELRPNTTMSQSVTVTDATPSVTNASIPIIGSTTDGINIISTTTTGNPVSIASKRGQETSLNDDLIGILNEVMEFLVSIAIPLSIILGIILIVSILIAICNLCAKRRKSKQFEVSDRFKFRYGSERKMFLKNRSKPVILEADQKSLSMGGTPQHKPLMTPIGREGINSGVGGKSREQASNKKKKGDKSYDAPADGNNFLAMSLFSGSDRNGDGGGYSGDHS